MIELDVADLVVITGRVLGIGTDAALDRLDTAAARVALREAGRRSGPARADRASVAAAGIGLMHALLTHRPFPRQGERVAVAAGLQFLSLNGWQADLDPPAAAAVVVEALASGRLSADRAAAWLEPRLTPSPAPAGRRPVGRVLAGAVLALAVSGVALLATACSVGPGSPGPAPRPAHTVCVQAGHACR